MSEFLVEAYSSRFGAVGVPGRENITAVAGELTSQDKPVHFVASIFVPEDETCFYLFEASSREFVREAATRSGLQFSRVLEAVSDRGASVCSVGPSSTGSPS